MHTYKTYGINIQDVTCTKNKLMIFTVNIPENPVHILFFTSPGEVLHVI